MKKIKNSFASIIVIVTMTFTYLFAQSSANAEFLPLTADNLVPSLTLNEDVITGDKIANKALPHLNLDVAFPSTLESQIERTDYENQSVFSLKTGDQKTVFLFSVTKVTGDVWLKVKNQLKDCIIVENKDSFITFVQKTDVKEIKGQANAQYQEALKVVNAIAEYIEVK